MDFKATHSKKKLWLFVTLFLLLLIAIYLGVSFYFRDRFYFGTIINGINCTGKTVSQVESLMSEEVSNYSLELIGRDNLTDSIKSSDINYQFISDGKVQELKDSQNSFAWIISCFSSNNHNELLVTTSYDKDLLKEKVDSMTFFKKENIIAPKSAKISYNKENGYYIKPETMGTKVNKKALLASIDKALQSNAASLNMDSENCYKNPKYTSESEHLTLIVAKAKKYSDITITYNFGSKEEIVDRDKIHNWLKINSKTGKITFDEEAVREFVDYIGRTYNTAYSTRTFTASSGKKVSVSGGDYGWLLNRPSEVTSLINTIKKGKSTTKKPVYLQTAASYDKPDYGDTFVEINITRQHLWFYKNGKLIVESDFVSGNESREGCATPLGTYYITYKKRDEVLGENNNLGYRSPVKYWMPFNRNVGMHDASWRHGRFGGTIYKTNGSHGCINLPEDKAAKIYENISAKVPVICYKE